MFGFESYQDRKEFVISNSVSLACVAVVAVLVLLVAGFSKYDVVISLAAFIWIFIGAMQFVQPFSNISSFTRGVVIPTAIIVFPFVYFYSVIIVILRQKK